MRTPTLDYASKLPSDDPSQACCIAREQYFDDSFNLRPSSRCKLADDEIALMETILMYAPEVRACALGTVHTIPRVDSPLLTPPARPRGERCTPTWLSLHVSDPWPSCAVDSAILSLRLPDIKESITAFASSCARPSADFCCVPVTLRSESVCRVKALGRPGVALARLVHLCGVWRHVRCTGALHVLSTCYELSGNKVVHSAEVRVSLQKCVLPNLGKKTDVEEDVEPHPGPRYLPNTHLVFYPKS